MLTKAMAKLAMDEQRVSAEEKKIVKGEKQVKEGIKVVMAKQAELEEKETKLEARENVLAAKEETVGEKLSAMIQWEGDPNNGTKSLGDLDFELQMFKGEKVAVSRYGQPTGLEVDDEDSDEDKGFGLFD